MYRKVVALVLVAVMCLTLASCSKSIGIIGGADGETMTVVEEKSQNTQSTCTPLLYKATDKDGNIAWLFGAIHIGIEDFYPLPDYIMNAFNSSNALAIECDGVDIENVFEYMKYTDNTTIKDHIDEELYDISTQILDENGILGEVSDSYMPSVWSLYIDRLTNTEMGFEPKYGVDSYLEDLAFECDKQVLEVEGDEIHGKAMAKLSNETQELMLANSVSWYLEKEPAKQSVDDLLDMWARGDETEISASLNAERQYETEEQKELLEEYDRVLRDERNDQMTEYVKNAMKDEKEIFVCVGQNHVSGKNSIVSQLKEQGYTVEIVK